MIQFKYYNEGATFDASSLNNDDIAFVEDENALYTHGKKFKFVEEPEVTPDASADPTPISQYGFYREVQLATDLQAKVLVDSNGRLILNVENDVTSALVWNIESGIIDVNSEGRYNTQLAEWIGNFGESQYSYMFNQTNQYTIIADSDEEDIEFNDATSEWSPTLTLFEPIAPLGKVQVFKDQSCTEYADGQSSIVYVRLNESFGYGDAYSWDHSAENDALVIFTPDDEDPQADYLIQLWIDWNSQLPRTQSWQAGSVVELTNETSYRVNEPKVIFE